MNKNFRKYFFRVRGNACHYCGKLATTIDHVVPKAKGGSDEIDNLVPSCYQCNHKKAARDYDETTGQKHPIQNFYEIKDIFLKPKLG